MRRLAAHCLVTTGSILNLKFTPAFTTFLASLILRTCGAAVKKVKGSTFVLMPKSNLRYKLPPMLHHRLWRESEIIFGTRSSSTARIASVP